MPDSPNAASPAGQTPPAPPEIPAPGVVMDADGPHHAMLLTDRCSAWMGIRVLQAEPGHARIAMTVRAEMTNGFDIIHGGMVFAFADTCFAMACNDPAGAQSTITVASGADISFVKAAALGEELTAEATEVTRSGRSGIYDVVVTRGEDTIAVFRGRSRTIPAPASTPGTATNISEKQ